MSTPLFTVYSLQDLMQLKPALEDFVLGDGLLSRGGKLLLYGAPGIGKTTLLDHLAYSLTTGAPFLDRFAVDRPHRVMVIQGELSQPELASHARELWPLYEGSPHTANLVTVDGTELRLPEHRQALRTLIRSVSTDIVVLDPFIKLFTGESIDKPEQVKQVLDVFDAFLAEGIVEAVIVAHHENVRGARTAGSWQFEAWPSTRIRITKASGGSSPRRVLHFQKVRVPGHSVPRKMDAMLLEGRYVAQGVRTAPPAHAGQPEADPNRLAKQIRGLTHFNDQLMMSNIQRETRATKAQIESAVESAPDLAFGILKRAGPGRPPRVIVVTPIPSDPSIRSLYATGEEQAGRNESLRQDPAQPRAS